MLTNYAWIFAHRFRKAVKRNMRLVLVIFKNTSATQFTILTEFHLRHGMNGLDFPIVNYEWTMVVAFWRWKVYFLGIQTQSSIAAFKSTVTKCSFASFNDRFTKPFRVLTMLLAYAVRPMMSSIFSIQQSHSSAHFTIFANFLDHFSFSYADLFRFEIDFERRKNGACSSWNTWANWIWCGNCYTYSLVGILRVNLST